MNILTILLLALLIIALFGGGFYTGAPLYYGFSGLGTLLLIVLLILLLRGRF